MVQDRDIAYLQWKINSKLYMVYEMARLPLTLSEFEGHFCCLNPL